jgi:hypothetical protein
MCLPSRLPRHRPSGQGRGKSGCPARRVPSASSPTGKPPKTPAKIAKIRYSVPMSLWLVENSQRRFQRRCVSNRAQSPNWLAAALLRGDRDFVQVSPLCGEFLGFRDRGHQLLRWQRPGRPAPQKPRLELLLSETTRTRDRHEGMVLAAQFGTLTVIDAFFAGVEPGLVQAARDRVDFDAECRHAKAWMTSSEVTCRRTVVSTGITIS